MLNCGDIIETNAEKTETMQKTCNTIVLGNDVLVVVAVDISEAVVAWPDGHFGRLHVERLKTIFSPLSLFLTLSLSVFSFCLSLPGFVL